MFRLSKRLRLEPSLTELKDRYNPRRFNVTKLRIRDFKKVKREIGTLLELESRKLSDKISNLKEAIRNKKVRQEKLEYAKTILTDFEDKLKRIHDLRIKLEIVNDSFFRLLLATNRLTGKETFSEILNALEESTSKSKAISQAQETLRREITEGAKDSEERLRLKEKLRGKILDPIRNIRVTITKIFYSVEFCNISNMTELAKILNFNESTVQNWRNTLNEAKRIFEANIDKIPENDCIDYYSTYFFATSHLDSLILAFKHANKFVGKDFKQLLFWINRTFGSFSEQDLLEVFVLSVINNTERPIWQRLSREQWDFLWSSEWAGRV